MMECLGFVAGYSARCGYLATNAADLVRHQAAIHPEQYAYDQEHAHETILELRRALARESRYCERLERELTRQRPVVDVAGFWHHARGWHRARWLARLRDRIVQMEAEPDALLN